MLVIYVYGLLFTRRNSYASTSNDSPIGQGPRPYVAYLENGNMKLFNMRNVSLKTCGCFDVVHRVCTYVAVAILFVCLLASSANAQLVHPGGWHTQEDLTLIREKIAAGESPWRRAWIVARSEGPDANFTSNPPALITNNGDMHTAGFAAWVLTMKWVASGDRAFSDAAIGIIDNWVARVRDFDVFAPTLTVSTGAGAMAQAAEILAHGFDGEAGWPQEDVAAAQVWFRDVIYEPQTNTGLLSSANFGTSALGGNMSMAIFMDDQERYNFQRQAYITGYNSEDGCNSLTDYIPFATGQAFETGRDQIHVQGGIAHLTEAALCLWNQGDPFIYLEENRLLAGVEYHARYNLGFDDLPPLNPDIPNQCNLSFSWLNSTEISPEGRGVFSPVYYMSAKLFSKAGLDHPNTQAVLTSPGYSPEINNFAHPGLGTFAFVSTDEDFVPRDIAVNIDIPDEQGDGDAEAPTVADFTGQNPDCLLDENTLIHHSRGVGTRSNFGSNFGSGVAVGNFTVSTSSSVAGTGTNFGTNAGDASHNDTDPITEGYAFSAQDTNVHIDGLLANSAAGDTIVLSIWGIGGTGGQQGSFTVTYGSNTASEGNTQETRYNGEGEPRNSAVGSIPFVNFTFIADGVTDQISFDIDNVPGTFTATINAFSLSVSDPPVILLGDVNLDGVVNFSDIPAFIALLQSGEFQAEADCNGSGDVDFSDIPFFIDILIAS